MERKLNLEEKDNVLRNEILLNKSEIDRLSEWSKFFKNKSSEYEKEVENLSSNLKKNILLRESKPKVPSKGIWRPSKLTCIIQLS